ncbi:MAG: hypothetical protein OEM41_03070 [Ignavibacteria bacterium]|nr:hypothetical protein [Ignavibacteria bacterium]
MNGIPAPHAPQWFFTFLLLLPLITGRQHLGDRETDFVVRLSSVPSPRGINATIVTTNLYPCAGYRLRSFATREVDTITIHINGMVRPVPCVQVGEVATGNAFLGVLTDSVYYLRVRYRGETDLHRMSVTRRHVAITPLTTRFTRIRGY